MSCGCNDKMNLASKKPTDACVFCAQKHASAALALYEKELDYKSINKAEAVGQMILCAWHLQQNHLDLARLCRSIWDKMQKLQDCAADLKSLNLVLWELKNKTLERKE